MSMSTNSMKTNNGPCNCCIRALKCVPVLFIVTILAWSYYAYVVQLCIFTVQTVAEQIIFLILYHILFFICLWSYWQTVFTKIGTVPEKFRLPPRELNKLVSLANQDAQKNLLQNFAKDLPIYNRTISGAVRFCDRCMLVKPDRAHHCSVCGTCVLKMDHHCPWVNNCVNFTNYKYFVLFLGYALVYCIYVTFTVLKYFILFWEGSLEGGMGRFHILFLFFVAVMFAISLVSLFGYHIYLVIRNRTTLEAFRAPIFRGVPDKNGYNLGYSNNLREVFGNDIKLWFLPVYTSLGNGVEYPIQSQHLVPVYESMGNTSTTTTTRLDDDLNNLNNSDSSVYDITNNNTNNDDDVDDVKDVDNNHHHHHHVINMNSDDRQSSTSNDDIINSNNNNVWAVPVNKDNKKL